MAPAITAPPMTPAATPGPQPPPPLHPHPRPRHWADESVMVAAKVATTIITTASKPADVFFISVSSGSSGR
jgi:hypothetical protein